MSPEIIIILVSVKMIIILAKRIVARQILAEKKYAYQLYAIAIFLTAT